MPCPVRPRTRVRFPPPPPLAQRSRLPGVGAGTKQDGLAEGTAAWRPVRGHYRAHQVAAGRRAPGAVVAGVDSVVAEYEVVTRRDARPPVGFVTSERRIDVR